VAGEWQSVKFAEICEHIAFGPRFAGELYAADGNERSITHHLAIYLQQEFDCWNVDVEYNRDDHDIKRLRDLRDVPSDAVYPDIIVHRRGTNYDNFLVIEVKKRDGGHGLDEGKLVEFTKPLTEDGLGYRWGLHLILQSNEQEEPSLKWFVQGKPHEE
jgi:hypothetical protein